MSRPYLLLVLLMLALTLAPAAAAAQFLTRDCSNCTCAAGCQQICFVGTARTTCGAAGLCVGAPECKKAAAGPILRGAPARPEFFTPAQSFLAGADLEGNSLLTCANSPHGGR